MPAVSNSTPLIFLAKMGKIQLLQNLFENVLIPREVYSEVVEQGKKRSYSDSLLIEELVRKGFIVTKNVDITVLKDANIEEGEKAAISLAVKENIKDILIDEAKVRRMAEFLGLRPRGTLWILSRAYEENLVSKEEFKTSIFELLGKGYRIKEEILVEILRELESCE